MMSQLFGVDDRTTVLSEVPLLDEIVRGQRADREVLFGAVLRLLGRPRSGRETQLVVKADCWHVFHAATLRRWYADASFLLLYRSPESVLASHARMRGGHMVPGVLPHSEINVTFDHTRMTLDDYAALVLGQYYRAMLEWVAADHRSLLLRYEEGALGAFMRAAHWLGMTVDAAGRQRLEDRSRFHAKRPDELFDAPLLAAPAGVDLTALHQLTAALDRVRGM